MCRQRKSLAAEFASFHLPGLALNSSYTTTHNYHDINGSSDKEIEAAVMYPGHVTVIQLQMLACLPVPLLAGLRTPYCHPPGCAGSQRRRRCEQPSHLVG